MPIQKPLVPILTAWKLKSGGEGLLFRPAAKGRGGTATRAPTFLQIHTLHRHFRKALAEIGRSRLTWYEATRHTFASQWVLAGGSIEKLAKIMGHSSVVVTERYAHLRPDLFRETDYSVLDVEMSRGEAAVLPMKQAEAGTIGYASVTEPS